MFSANNFYQWTYETYLKDKNFSLITYHPMGSRGYKNLHKWDLTLTENVDAPDAEVLENAQVLMNDQEPILLDSIYNWKKEHTPRLPFNTIWDLYNRDSLGSDYWFNDADKSKWQKEKGNYTNAVEHFLKNTTDKTFVSQLLLPGILKPIIVHSELNSAEVKELEDEFIPVYVFWHGLISRDWYRHWKHNTSCTPNINRSHNQKRFLLYARAWTRSRQYRLQFVENLIKSNLHNTVKYNFFELDDGEYYREHCDTDIDQFFPKKPEQEQEPFFEQICKGFIADNYKPEKNQTQDVTSSSSAYIDIRDYQSTAIQIVAETLFETEKIYLTEKTFQPIVAGQPFLTLSAPGTLATLRNYGFKTFSDVWDESYDTITDHDQRMQAVIVQLENLTQLSQDKFTALYEKCLAICEHNRRHFFSEQFEEQILNEYKTNFETAFIKQQQEATKNPGGSRFKIAEEICFSCYNTEFFYEQDQHYLRYMLAQARAHSEEQYQAILDQYWWARKLIES